LIISKPFGRFYSEDRVEDKRKYIPRSQETKFLEIENLTNQSANPHFRCWFSTFLSVLLINCFNALITQCEQFVVFHRELENSPESNILHHAKMRSQKYEKGYAKTLLYLMDKSINH